MRGSVILELVLVGIAVFFAVGSFSYNRMAGFVPLALSIPTLCLALLVLAGERFPGILKVFEVSLEDVLTSVAGEGNVESPVEPTKPKGNDLKVIIMIFGWFAAFAVVLFFLGFYIATGVFALLFTRFQGKLGWPGAVFMTLLGLGFFYIAFQEALGVDLFEGVLFDAQVPPL
jgi:hypothetical protein